MATSRSRETHLFRTTDLTLASYLCVQGFGCEMVESDDQVKEGHPQGAWEFEETPALKRVAAEFNNGEAKVEPRAFHRMVNSTRKEMFDFLGIGNR